MGGRAGLEDKFDSGSSDVYQLVRRNSGRIADEPALWES